MWRMTKKMKKNKRGSILPFAVVLVILLFVMGLALTRLGLNARMAAARTTAEISARAAADAGFAQAIRLMNKSLAKKPWDGTPIPAVSDVMLSGSDARYSYNVTKKGTYYQVASTGESGIAQRKVYGILTLESLLSGIGVKKVIDLKVGVTFSAKPKSRFAMRTNSIEDNAIILKSGVTIPGDVICGPGGDPDEVINVKSTTTILGDSYAAQSEIDFPPVVLPDDIKNVPLTPYTYSPGSPIVGSADPTKFTYIPPKGSGGLEDPTSYLMLRWWEE